MQLDYRSTNNGTVVEVNRDVSKSTTNFNQTLVHIVNNGNLQVKLSEYNLANLSVEASDLITSKVYPDRKLGKSISNYPKTVKIWQQLVQVQQEFRAKIPLYSR